MIGQVSPTFNLVQDFNLNQDLDQMQLDVPSAPPYPWTGPFRFLDLPVEIRYVFYETIFSFKHMGRSLVVVPLKHNSPRSAQLLRVCRQIHDEARSVYLRETWSKTNFVTNVHEGGRLTDLSALPYETRSQLFHLNLDGYPQPMQLGQFRSLQTLDFLYGYSLNHKKTSDHPTRIKNFLKRQIVTHMSMYSENGHQFRAAQYIQYVLGFLPDTTKVRFVVLCTGRDGKNVADYNPDWVFGLNELVKLLEEVPTCTEDGSGTMRDPDSWRASMVDAGFVPDGLSMKVQYNSSKFRT